MGSSNDKSLPELPPCPHFLEKNQHYNHKNKETGVYVYSQPITEKKENETPIYRHVENIQQLTTTPEQNMITLQDLILKCFMKYGKQQFLGTRKPQTTEYNFKTYLEVYDICRMIGSGIMNLSLCKRDIEYNATMIGVFSKNREEWLCVEISGLLYNFQTVPIYDTLGKQAVSFILNQTEITTIFCSLECLKIFKNYEQGKIKQLICFDKLEQNEEITQMINFYKQKNIEVLSWESILNNGKNYIQPIQKVTIDDIYTFSYTSGTTGNPKGAIISHRNIMAAVGQTVLCEAKMWLEDGGTHLSFLPYPHIFEKKFTWVLIYYGHKICYYSGDPKSIPQDIMAAKPTVLFGVPRVFTRIYDKIKERVDSLGFAKKALFYKAYNAKLENLRKGPQYQHKVYDYVFSQVRELLGGRCRVMLSGLFLFILFQFKQIIASAPMKEEIIEFLKITCSVYLFNACGQTENAAASFFTSTFDNTGGHVGGCCKCQEVKLIDVPEMGYYSTDKDDQGNSLQRGEILIRGDNIIKAYYKDLEKTKETIDSEGWLHTGDIGQILNNSQVSGAFQIIDRKSNIIKLSQGEFVATEKIELIYQRNQWIQDIYVHGNSLYSQLIGIATPNKEKIEQYAQQNKIQYNNYKELCENQVINQMILKELYDLGKKEGLFGFEQIYAIKLIETNFQDEGILTPSFKIKRHEAKIKFKEHIEKLYSKFSS